MSSKNAILLKLFFDRHLNKIAKKEEVILDSQFKSCSGIIIYGWGQLGRKIFHGLIKAGVRISAIVDQNFVHWNSDYEGCTIISPDEAAKKYYKDHLCVVTVIRNYEKNLKYLKKLGFLNVSYFLPVLWRYPNYLLPQYNIDLPSKMLQCKKVITEAYNILEDDESRNEFLNQLKWMVSLTENKVPACEPHENQYFPNNLFKLKPDEVFIDCGAYDGDTILTYLKTTDDKFSKIIAFEPDAKNVELLKETISKKYPNLASRIEILDCGAGSYSGTASFSADGNEASHICSDGENSIRIIKIDSIPSARNATYIKMDIEGAELDALKGCEDIIKLSIPKLAVCVYHKQDHLWEIPLFIKKINPSYKIFIRRYRDEYGDVVCYAIPKS
jgi:FkbM family methyltransferase